MRRLGLPLMLTGGCIAGFDYTDTSGTPGDSDTGALHSEDDGGGRGSGGKGGGGKGGGGKGGGSGNGTTEEADTPMITEVFDGRETAELQYVEIFNPTLDTFDLDGWKLNVGYDRDTTLTYTFRSVQLASGEAWVLCSEAGASAFQAKFGFPCDDTHPSVLDDGDEPVVLLDSSNRPHDRYGQGNGTNADWNYADSVAKRKTGALPTYDFNLADWTLKAGEGSANPGHRD